MCSNHIAGWRPPLPEPVKPRPQQDVPAFPFPPLPKLSATPQRNEPVASKPRRTAQESRTSAHHAPHNTRSREAASQPAGKNTTDRVKEADDQDEENGAVFVCLPALPVQERSDSEGGDNMSGARSTGEIAASFMDMTDTELLVDQLAPLAGAQGIFEVLLPNGGTLGVVVDVQPSAVHYLLSASNPKLSERLRNEKEKRELKGGLERRIGRNVMLAVL